MSPPCLFLIDTNDNIPQTSDDSNSTTILIIAGAGAGIACILAVILVTICCW